MTCFGIAALSDRWLSPNPGQQWKTTIDGRGFTVSPDSGGWEWGLELAGFGGVTDVRHEGGKLSRRRGGGLTEWFVNDSRGLEQGWTLERRPDRMNPGEPLRLMLRVRGGLNPRVAEGGGSIGFVNESGATALTYGGLKAWDAGGKTIQVCFVDGEPGSSGFEVAVDDGDASYPITIDAIAQQAYLKPSNTGVGDFGALFGVSVAVSGDTVVVGALGEDSNATGVDGNQEDDSAPSGAAYIFSGIGVSAAPGIMITDSKKNGQIFTINFTSEPGLGGWRIKGSATLDSFPDDLTAVTTFSEVSPGIYQSATNLTGYPAFRYFLRVER